MMFERLKNRTGTGLLRTAGAVGALALGATLMASPQSAFAANNPSVKELLDACGWADSCDFHPTSYWTYTGPRHQVGSTAFNCGSRTNQHQIRWADTTAATNTVGVKISAEAQFWGAYKVGVETSYGHSWSSSHTDSEANTVNVPPGSKGWLERGTSKQQAKGWYEIHFPSRYYGHYIWYVNNYQSAGFNEDKPSGGYINFKEARMTSGERNQHCR